MVAFVALGLARAHVCLGSQKVAADDCPRPSVGSVVQQPEDLRSRNGVLKVDLTVRDSVQPDGSTRYCYIDGHGDESPTLRVNPGDLVILNLKNDLTAPGPHAAALNHQHMQMGSEAR